MPTEPAYRTDVLGEPYRSTTFTLAPDADGELTATLVRRRAATATRRAVLSVHGFSDYFFNTAAADHWVSLGYDFYALDLRRYGRSMGPHQRKGYVADLAEYDEELDLAWEEITREHDHVVLSAHSTGGLTVPLWVDRRREAMAGTLKGMVLNAPWLDLQGGALLRRVGAPAIALLGRLQPLYEIPRKADGFYTRALHRDHQGEWEFDLAMKPVESFPIHAGWLRAVLRGQARLARGLDVPVPVLVLCSSRSGHPTSIDDASLRTTDVVLDVEQIRRRAPLIGRHVTVAMIAGAIHEVMLSAEPVRKVVFDEVDRFCAAYVDR
ncbi:alpha/beta hydrolase [Nocardioides terrisoli]|uniref:alpha/beta hydrolase n=1 Tax=Nocardioides terrisoli TaxID=3388267 RepID=UPI00287B80D9|nr:alpha/beta hydrolase [Nocardioides marmorisolisilvae]